MKRGKRNPDNKGNSGVDKYKKGKEFEQKVGYIFDLMGFHVEFNRERETAGNEIDIFLKKKKRLGNKYEYYICECKAWNKKVGIDIVNKFNYLRVGVEDKLKEEKLARSCEAIIVSPKGFTEPAKEAADTNGIILNTYDELFSQLMNFDPYLTALIQNYERDPETQLHIEQDLFSEVESKSHNSFNFIKEWLRQPERKHLSLLGEYGTGKTSFAKAITYRMAKEFKNNPGKCRIPFLIDLKDYKGVFKLKNLIQYHLKRARVEPADDEIFLSLLSYGHVLLIFDAFDEMAVMNNEEDTLLNFKQLSKTVLHNAKVILISRAHYFRDKGEIDRILKKQGIDDISELASLMYRKISKRSGCEIIHLKKFSDTQIREYLKKTIKEEWKTAYRKIESVYSLYDLACRPVLLEMIVKTLPEIGRENKKFNLTHLYEAYTLYWLERDRPRMQITKEVIEELVEVLAYKLWDEGVLCIHYTSLLVMISEHLKVKINVECDPEVADKELRTASFLIGDEEGNYSFAHESFQEFFVARKIKKELLKENFDVLDLKLLSEEIVFFLSHLMGDNRLTIGKIACLMKGKYRTRISENALFIFYTILKMDFLKQRFLLKENIEISFQEAETFKKEEVHPHLPQKLQFQGALLCNWNLPYMIFRNTNFTETKMDNSIFRGTSFEGVLFIKTHMENSDFSGSIFKNVRFEEVKAHYCNFKNCQFFNCTMICSDFSMGNFMDTEFNSCERFEKNDFTGVGFCISDFKMNTFKNNCFFGVGVLEVEKVKQAPVLVDQGHEDIIRAVAISKDGRFMVSGSDDKTVKLWDLKNGRLIKTLEGHVRTVLSVFISPDNRWILSGSSDNTVKLWNLETGHMVTTLKDHSDWVNSVFASLDKQQIVSSSSDYTIKLWDLEDGHLIKTLGKHNRAVLSACIIPESQQIVSVSSDHEVKIWDLEDGHLIKTLQLKERSQALLTVYISQDNRWIASSGYDKMVKLWDLDSGSHITALEGHNDWVRSICISSDNRCLVSGGDDKTVKLWDIKRGHHIKTFEGHANIVNSVSISHDNRIIVSGSFDETIKIWDVESGQLVRTLEGYKESINYDITNPKNRHRLYYRDRLALYPSCDLVSQNK
jgi:WD40 repeat protein/DNA polymerase III delta prime subunit